MDQALPDPPLGPSGGVLVPFHAGNMAAYARHSALDGPSAMVKRRVRSGGGLHRNMALGQTDHSNTQLRCYYHRTL